MTLEKFERLLGQVSKLCDKECKDIKEKERIENGLIELWNEYRDLVDTKQS